MAKFTVSAALGFLREDETVYVAEAPALIVVGAIDKLRAGVAALARFRPEVIADQDSILAGPSEGATCNDSHEQAKFRTRRADANFNGAENPRGRITCAIMGGNITDE